MAWKTVKLHRAIGGARSLSLFLLMGDLKIKVWREPESIRYQPKPTVQCQEVQLWRESDQKYRLMVRVKITLLNNIFWCAKTSRSYFHSKYSFPSAKKRFSFLLLSGCYEWHIFVNTDKEAANTNTYVWKALRQQEYGCINVFLNEERQRLPSSISFRRTAFDV